MGVQLEFNFLDTINVNLEMLCDSIIDAIEDVNCPLSDYIIKEEIYNITDSLNTICPCDPEFVKLTNNIKNRIENVQMKVVVKNNIQEAIDNYVEINDINESYLFDDNSIKLINEYNSIVNPEVEN